VATAITLRSSTDEKDARAIPPVESPENLKLNLLRQNLGTWMGAEDQFLSKQKVPIDKDSEPKWSVKDAWDSDTTAVLLVRRVVKPGLTDITIKSAVDESDLFALPPGHDPKGLTLDGLRRMIGEWLLERDQFLTRAKAPITREQEGNWLAADVATGNTVLIRREVQTVAIRLKRAEGAETESGIHFAANTKLAEVRRRLEARGDMTATDVFINSDGREQVPIGDEAIRSLQSALKDKTLQINSRADWG
jgi:hypothetical protein